MTMSATFNSNRSVPLGSVSIFRATTGVEFAMRAFASWRRARTTRLALANLSDAQLADIGVTRGDIAMVSDSLSQR
ncbi:MAG: DUF1127 domain-containing protein [Amaricoccus sp.]|uniref:DUF1127 domain-containing protein n=1 Tax=Amaricoccus sp. TaxID=1872485 RepID=UPI0039E48979